MSDSYETAIYTGNQKLVSNLSITDVLERLNRADSNTDLLEFETPVLGNAFYVRPRDVTAISDQRQSAA